LSILLTFSVVELLVFVWVFTTPSMYLPSDYWDLYLKWLWPS
jgi:hypothetical protein